MMTVNDVVRDKRKNARYHAYFFKTGTIQTAWGRGS